MKFCVICGDDDNHNGETCPQSAAFWGMEDNDEPRSNYITCRGGCGNAHAEKNGICSSCGYYNG